MRRIAVIGCGSVGSLVAAAAAAAGVQVVLHCLREAPREALVRVHAPGMDAVAKPAYRVYTGSIDEQAEAVVVAVRTGSLDEVLAGLQHGPRLVLVQPSLRLLELEGDVLALYTCVRREPLTGGVTVSPGIVRAHGKAALEIAAWMERLGLRLGHFAGTREQLVWDYAAAHAAVQPVAAVTGSPLHVIRRGEHALALVDALAREALNVAEAAGVRPVRSLVDAARELLGVRDCYPRMLADIEEGRPTEVEYMNALIVREALRRDVYAPYNDSVYLAVKAIEEAREAIKARRGG